MHDENQKPDYSFIMNQPGFEPASAPKRSKGFMFILIAVALLGVVTVVGLFARRSPEVQQVAGSQQAAQTAAKQYMDNLANAKYGEAYDMVTLADETKAIPRETFVNTLGPIIGKKYDYSSCELKNAILAGNTYKIHMECSYKDSQIRETLIVTTTTANNQVRIIEVASAGGTQT